MSINMKHSNGPVGALMAADRQADSRSQAVGGVRLRTDLTESERDDACAAIDDAMQSVGQVLEVALQAMGNLRVARAALVRYDDGPPLRTERGGACQRSR
ncbi:hypothetical protein [Burkholderia sp. LMG 32019]|uniref:hypothetical protein n=1 Tax=Burkholderia sp. LMG 32019 TaxID=3158173 RepID=UPI003C2C3349